MYPGSRVWVVSKPKFPFAHKGLYIENVGVFEICSEHPFPRWISWPEFNAKGDATGEEKFGVDIPMVLSRIQGMINSQEKYDAISFNCEHAVAQALTGRRDSPQLQALAGFGVFALVLAVAARA